MISSNSIKLVLIILCVLVLGLPLNELWKLILFTITVWLILQGSLSCNGKRWLLALAIYASVIIAKWVIPQAHIQEGHNLFLYAGPHQVFEQYLPTPVFKVLKDEFDRSYPLAHRCSKEQYGCWKAFGTPQNLYGFSTDGIWLSPKYSRVVNKINFNNFQTLRLGAINDVQYNYYNDISDIKRASAPFFIMYELPRELKGSRLCWKGNILWERSDGLWEHIQHTTMTCRSLSPLPRHLYAYRMNSHSELALRLELPWTLAFSNFFQIILSAIGCLTFISLLLRVQFNTTFVVNASLLVSMAIWIFIIAPNALMSFVIYAGGGDGLTHEGFGRVIVYHLLKGEWALALQGGESIFYYMPGMRYFRALEKIIFGETTYGYVCVLFCLPFIVLRFLRLFVSSSFATILMIFFIAIPIFHSFSFAAYDYVREALKKGYAEPLGYGAFILGFTYILERFKDDKQQTLWHGFWGHFALAVAIAIRPNLALPSLVFLILVHLHYLFNKRWRDLFLTPLGITPVFLITAHNWWFGHTFVPLTSAAFIPANLLIHPTTYVRAVRECVDSLWNGPHIQLVTAHLLKWIPLSQCFRIIPLIATLYVAFQHKADISLRICAQVALAMQIQLLFYVPSGRYSMLAWMFCFVVLASLVEQFYRQKPIKEQAA